MDQITFSEAEYQNNKCRTCREVFLERTHKLIPWKQLEKKVALYYPKGQTGRPSYALGAVLRVHYMPLLYHLRGPVMENTPSEIEPLRHLADLKLELAR